MREKTAGFSLLELLIVIGLLVAIATFITLGFQNYTEYQRYDYAVGTVEAGLRESRANARHAVGGTAHGVKIASTTLTLFNGSTYSFGDPDNVVVELYDSSVTFNLSDSSDEIIFSALHGLPSATGTITVTGITHSASTTFTITATGELQ